jgi:hypothetical protein
VKDATALADLLAGIVNKEREAEADE